MAQEVTHLNPAGMHSNPAFSQAVVVEGNARTIYVGGQNGVDADGHVVGVGDLAAQTERTMENLTTVLAAGGARFQDIVKWTIFVVQGHDFLPAAGIVMRMWGTAPPPAISVVVVAGLAHPDFLVEVEAVAVTGHAAGRDA
jgi:enamine deaminase RidA (YjgF/YER057c/UK114 family)